MNDQLPELTEKLSDAFKQLAKIAEKFGMIHYSDTYDVSAKVGIDEADLLMRLNNRKGIKFEYGVSVLRGQALVNALA